MRIERCVKKRKTPFFQGKGPSTASTTCTRNTRHQAEEKGEMSNRRGLENEPSKRKQLPSVTNKMMLLKKPCDETEAVKEDE